MLETCTLESKSSRINTITLSGYDDKEDSCALQMDRDIALNDLRHDSFFQPAHDDYGPYALELYIEDNRLIFHIANNRGKDLPYLVLSINPYRRIIKDYFMICQSYDEAVREGKPSRVEAIDMGRRGIHNEGAELLLERLGDKIKLDIKTARRLFTLICVLHAGKTHALR